MGCLPSNPFPNDSRNPVEEKAETVIVKAREDAGHQGNKVFQIQQGPDQLTESVAPCTGPAQMGPRTERKEAPIPNPKAENQLRTNPI